MNIAFLGTHYRPMGAILIYGSLVKGIMDKNWWSLNHWRLEMQHNRTRFRNAKNRKLVIVLQCRSKYCRYESPFVWLSQFHDPWSSIFEHRMIFVADRSTFKSVLLTRFPRPFIFRNSISAAAKKFNNECIFIERMAVYPCPAKARLPCVLFHRQRHLWTRDRSLIKNYAYRGKSGEKFHRSNK